MSLHLLPKKSWHVWNPENLDKVRQDEAKHAAEIDKQRSLNVASDQNALFDTLRRRAAGETSQSLHVSHLHNSGSEAPAASSGVSQTAAPNRPNKGPASAPPADGIALVDDATRAGPWYTHSRGRGPWDPHHDRQAQAQTQTQAAGTGPAVSTRQGLGPTRFSSALARDDPLSVVRRTFAKAGYASGPALAPLSHSAQPRLAQALPTLHATGTGSVAPTAQAHGSASQPQLREEDHRTIASQHPQSRFHSDGRREKHGRDRRRRSASRSRGRSDSSSSSTRSEASSSSSRSARKRSRRRSRSRSGDRGHEDSRSRHRDGDERYSDRRRGGDGRSSRREQKHKRRHRSRSSDKSDNR